ncbi:hypothetical protein IFM12275_23660 [Nocardia sputorum]|uniref:nitroreductase family deazaflavin-dependent oxidoreductase n=1 Tax=Nocardia sputorum TaxID=2984338 RepID=UPI0024903654|nr:nitroreductase family deazaflavin-dependent oxidoreductase [Nocardia sputorum]BDT92390.1 hypothetical protein IFM12275_23660 [Nocardia sputorum]
MNTPLPEIDPMVAESDPAAMADFNRRLIAQFHANGGRLSGQFAELPVLLLTTIGARSGLPRTAPLCYARDGQNYIVAASKAGAATNPDWFHNLVARSTVTVDLGPEVLIARARVAEGPERARLFERLTLVLPILSDYQHKTRRQIPVIVLERTS